MCNCVQINLATGSQCPAFFYIDAPIPGVRDTSRKLELRYLKEQETDGKLHADGIPNLHEIDIPENHCGQMMLMTRPCYLERVSCDDSEEEDIFEDTVEELDDEHVLLEENGGVPPEECLPLYDGALITEPLSSLAILAFALRHSLTKVAVRDLLQLINIHLPVSCLPETFYLFSKNFDERTEEVEFHTYCKACLNYLGMDSILSCTVCGKNNIMKSDLVKDGFYFINLPLSTQLRDIMETPSLTQHFLNKEQIEVIWNCDGMPAFQSEQRSQRGMEDQAIRLGSGMPQDEGVKEISPLLVLPRFDIVRGFPVDYMHAVCEGVGQHLLNLWFDRTHHNKEWFIGNSLSTVMRG
ncbi:hypothetical protein BSL78_22453 [Apostichopus japonicus]|uniref:Uncharacterized protein n=1 Tax=Stichopus japonicus TaxID=307972 RepID=A0A2G8JY73_STIJA|nr:hypothetical protein BSL78_22453 [Apostichopus japonicus]